MSNRKAITERQKIDCLLARANAHGRLACAICDRLIFPGQVIEWDHIHAVCADGPHNYENLRPLHRACHTRKSALDIALNAKTKRIANGGRKRKGPKMKSRPFQKTHRKLPTRADRERVLAMRERRE